MLYVASKDRKDLIICLRHIVASGFLGSLKIEDRKYHAEYK